MTAKESEIMCDCTGTSKQTIKRLFTEGYDLDSISRKTGILTGCGGCEWDIQAYLDELNTVSDDDH